MRLICGELLLLNLEQAQFQGFLKFFSGLGLAFANWCLPFAKAMLNKIAGANNKNNLTLMHKVKLMENIVMATDQTWIKQLHTY